MSAWSLTCTERSWKVSRECTVEGTQKLPSCTRSGMLQAASFAFLAVVLRDLAYVSPEQAVLHCPEPSAIDLSVPQAKSELQ